MDAPEPDAWKQPFIQRQRVARLATVDTQCRPHIVPVVFGFDGQRLFTPIDQKPKRVGPHQLQRVRNIQANPEVMVLFDQYDEVWSKLAWVQVRGLAVFVEEGPDREFGITLLLEKYPQYSEETLAGLPVIVITVKSMLGWRALAADQ